MTFVELIDHLDSSMETRGDHCYEFQHNIVAWIGMSERLVNLLLELKNEERIHMWPTSRITYMIDGRHLILPIAKNPIRRKYKEPHWLPVTMRPGPMP